VPNKRSSRSVGEIDRKRRYAGPDVVLQSYVPLEEAPKWHGGPA
jgi:hypothetical protein